MNCPKYPLPPVTSSSICNCSRGFHQSSMLIEHGRLQAWYCKVTCQNNTKRKWQRHEKQGKSNDQQMSAAVGCGKVNVFPMHTGCSRCPDTRT
jgi:hypothetical protein